jgi:FMN-dependent NADH-azoreductase
MIMKLLHIDSSPMGEGCITRELTREFVQRWRCANPEGEVIPCDLTALDIPAVDAAWVDANYTPKEKRTPEQNRLLAPSTRFVEQLADAREYVIGVPMHNWGPSARFKLWADQIVRFGETVLITPSGLQGALGGKKATCFVAAGRRYGPGFTDTSNDHLSPWLRTFFGSLGIKDLHLIFADGTAAVRSGRISREAFLAPYFKAMDYLFMNPALSA